MAKIIEVLNTMISKKEKITNVIKKELEYFFIYNSKYKWSIVRDNNENYFVHFYPDASVSIEQLSEVYDWNQYNFVTYSTDDFKTNEAIETFRELYQIVSDKVYGLDDMFDEIINS